MNLLTHRGGGCEIIRLEILQVWCQLGGTTVPGPNAQVSGHVGAEPQLCTCASGDRAGAGADERVHAAGVCVQAPV